MVGADMALRLRSVLGLVGVIALLTVVVGSATPRADGTPQPRTHTAVVVKSASAHAGPAARGHRPLPLPFGLLLAATALAAIAVGTRRGADRLRLVTVDRPSRRWRALLLGAPPVSA
jgi:hypothetical protein